MKYTWDDIYDRADGKGYADKTKFSRGGNSYENNKY